MLGPASEAVVGCCPASQVPHGLAKVRVHVCHSSSPSHLGGTVLNFSGYCDSPVRRVPHAFGSQDGIAGVFVFNHNNSHFSFHGEHHEPAGGGRKASFNFHCSLKMLFKLYTYPKAFDYCWKSIGLCKNAQQVGLL